MGHTCFESKRCMTNTVRPEHDRQISLRLEGKGPIVRINPEELSLRDSSMYNEIYVTGSKRRTDKYEGFLKGSSWDGIPLPSLAPHDVKG